MTLVLDASVWLKWLLADPQSEPDTAQAIALVQAGLAGEHALIMPPHWLAEVAAVLARGSPQTAADDVMTLRALELPVSNEPAVWQRATELAISAKQHVFDTLYHAVALSADQGMLVTADERYWSAAHSYGHIVRLSEWQNA